MLDKEVYSNRETFLLMEEMFDAACVAHQFMRDGRIPEGVDSRSVFLSCMKAVMEYERQYPDATEDENYLWHIDDIAAATLIRDFAEQSAA